MQNLSKRTIIEQMRHHFLENRADLTKADQKVRELEANAAEHATEISDTAQAIIMHAGRLSQDSARDGT